MRPLLNSNQFRSHFPLLQNISYLASCSLGARSTYLERAMAEMLEDMHRQGIAWSKFEEVSAQVRQRIAHFFNCDKTQLAYTADASMGAYQIASTLNLHKRRKIVTSSWEFPSISHVWLAQQSRGAQVVHCDGTCNEEIIAEYRKLMDENTALVSIPLVAFSNGAILPVEQLITHAKEVGAKVFIDAYQGAGIVPIDLAELQCDYLVTGAYKYLLGLPGLAFLFVRHFEADDLSPSLTGWLGRAAPMDFDPYTLDYSPEARRYEVGTPSIPTLYAINAACDLFEQVDMHSVYSHATHLNQLAEKLLLGQGFTLGAHKLHLARRGPMIAALVDNPPHIAEKLNQQQIVLSPRKNSLRFAFHYYNTEEDVIRACEALALVAKN